MKIRKQQRLPIDPAVRRLSAEEVGQHIAQYVCLLDSEVREGEIHKFLATHSYFFNGIIRLFGRSPIYSKIKLGSNYEVDFAFFDTGSFGPEWHLIEIEPPSARMFNRKGDPTATLTHAMGQVRKWHAWVHDNLSYAQKLMPHIEYPLGYVFLGRRRELTHKTMHCLRELAHDHRRALRIHTLDWFVDAAHSVKKLLSDSGSRGGWPVPMHAMSHSDLAAQRPDFAFDWLNRADHTQELASSQQLRMNAREYHYLQLAEYREDDPPNSEPMD
jgi:hypothetical protein